MEDLTPYEIERLERIKRNRAMMDAILKPHVEEAKTLVTIKPPPKPRNIRPRVQGPHHPTRRSTRVVGVAADRPEGLAFDDNDNVVERESWDDSEVEYYSSGRMPRVRMEDADYDVAWDGKLPPWRNIETGETSTERNKSCHICTQCTASWRGAFPQPLGCSTCKLIWCNRCLFHVTNAETVEMVDAWIQENQGVWSCLMCTGKCACQDPSLPRGMPKIEKHKSRGWVGVTGGSAYKARKPKVCCRRGGGAAALPAPEKADSEQAEGGSGPPTLGAATPPLAAEPATPEGAAGGGGVSGGGGGGEGEGAARAAVRGAAVADALGSVGLGKRRRAPSPPEPETPTAAEEAGASEPRPRRGAATLPPAAEAGGKALIGRRVKAFWPTEKAWFPGTIASYSAAKGTHKIAYDDGDYEHVGLPDATVKFI